MAQKNLKAQNLRIIKDPEKPETPELLAKAIIQIGNAMNHLVGEVEGGLKQRALIVLLKGMPELKDVTATEIKLVLDNLPKLVGYYLRG